MMKRDSGKFCCLFYGINLVQILISSLVKYLYKTIKGGMAHVSGDYESKQRGCNRCDEP